MGVSLCVQWFGAYWPVKSRDGMGCVHPVTEENEPPPKQAKKEEPRKIEPQPRKPRIAIQEDLFEKKEPPPLTDEDY